LYVNSRRTIAGDRTAFYHAAPNFPARRSKVGLPRIHPEPSLEGEACNGPSGKVTVDGTDSDGKPVHNEWTGKYDGKDYPVTGSSTEDTRSYKKVDAHTLVITNKKGDKVTISGRAVVSADGKTRTVTITGTDPKGKKFTSTAVYDKQ